MRRGRIIFVPAIVFVVATLAAWYAQAATVLREGGKTYIVDMRGERWDVTQAESLGFDPRGFQYGIGRNAFVPLDDSRIGKGDDGIPDRTRVIGVRDGSSLRAYSVPTLRSHEVANSNLGGNPLAVGY